MQEVFTLSEARALQRHQLCTTQDVKDEFDRILIPATSVWRVMGLDAWADHEAVSAIQWADDGVFPKGVLVNKTTDDQHVEDVSVQPAEADGSRREPVSFPRDEALANIGRRVQLHAVADDSLRTSFSTDVPAGTTGQVIHANLSHRFTHPEYEPADFYEVVIAWNALERRIDMFDASDYKRFIAELA